MTVLQICGAIEKHLLVLTYWRVTIIIVMTVITTTNVYGDVKESTLHFDECRLSAGWPPTLRPSQSTWAVSPPKIGCYHRH